MSIPPSNPGQAVDPHRDELMSALFANMVVQQTNMALVFLGQAPHPETRKTIQDLEAAQMFIDQLEMLSVKTRGNLGKQEERLLQQSLMTLRMSFVEAVEKGSGVPSPLPNAPAGPSEAAPENPAASAAPLESPVQAEAGPPEPAGEESRKRFTKKY